jgi:S-adenosylmethionine:tRNA ribosyltransferase-isomerase
MRPLAFELPQALEATAPPEARGLERDRVRLLAAGVGGSDAIVHARFDELPDLLDPGDLLVVNVSATLPASVPARLADGTPIRVNFATRAPGLDDRWRVVELRTAGGASPLHPRARRPSGEIALAGGASRLELVAPYAFRSRLWLAQLHGGLTPLELMRRHGEPIRYGYVRERWPLSDYQTVFATVPGSAEMPSAGRPFSRRLLVALAARGIGVAPITLHTGVSSPERHEPPFPEQYAVPDATAALVNRTRGHGGRVIAVGTTVVRALQTVTDAAGTVARGDGWTGIVIDPDSRVSAVDGLITGWHEPRASHLEMLAAIAGERLLERCYEQALRHGYLWHEFGDSHLIIR